MLYEVITDAFEPAPGNEPVVAASASAPQVAHAGPQAYDVRVNGQLYQVEVAESGQISQIVPAVAAPAPVAAPQVATGP